MQVYKIPKFTTAQAQNPWHREKTAIQNYWKQTKGGGIVVAILDTGIDLKHPDFEGRIIDSQNFLDAFISAQDDNGHGTHVAGIIAGASTGIAPEARIMACKIGDADGYIDPEAAKEALRHIKAWNREAAEADKVRYVNCSWGGPDSDTELLVIIQSLVQAGVSVYVAAGNSGDGRADTIEPAYPALWNEAIVIGAIDQQDKPAKWNSSHDGLDVITYGVDIYSCWPGGGYKALSGTSMATPMALGQALILEAANSQIWDDDQRFSAMSRQTLPIDGERELVGKGIFSLSNPVQYETKIEMTIGSKTYFINGEPVEMDVAPVIIDERTLLPVRFVAEPLGALVEWDAKGETVTIRK